MKNTTERIAIGEVIIGGGIIGFILDEDTEKFPTEITFINKTDDGIFQFGNDKNKMFNYEEWENFIKNDPTKTMGTKNIILDKLKKEIDNY